MLPAHDNVIRVITESEDHVTRKTFTINLGTEQEFPADSDERDYPAADMTVTAGSEQTSGTATEARRNSRSTATPARTGIPTGRPPP